MRKNIYFILLSSFLLVVFCHPKKIHLVLIILQTFKKNQKSKDKTKKPTKKCLQELTVDEWKRLEHGTWDWSWTWVAVGETKSKEVELSGVGWIRIFKYGVCWISTWLGRWAWKSMRRQVWVKITCENLDAKTKQLYWSVVGLIEKEKHEKIHKYFPASAIGKYWAKCIAFREDGKLLWATLFISRSKICVFL